MRQPRPTPEGFTPLWRMPSQDQAIEILRTCRAWTDALVAELSPKERAAPASIGGDERWSVNDLLGHLATHEHVALVVLGARRPTADDRLTFPTVAAFNAHHLGRKRTWSARKQAADYAKTRDELVEAIASLPEERWFEKIPAGRGRSALALVVARRLNGDAYGYFAHDLAHARDLARAVRGPDRR